MRPLVPYLSTSWGAGRPASPAPGAPGSTSWGSGRPRAAGALLALVLGCATAMVGVAGGTATVRPAPTAGSAAVRPDATTAAVVHDPSGPGVSAQQALGLAGLGSQGAGERIAVLDSGVEAVPALAGRVVQGPDLTGQGTADRYGHGTFVAGLIAGDGTGAGRAATGIVGVAPRATIISVKVIRNDGSSDVRTLVAGLSWVLTHHAVEHIDVVNLSLSVSTPDPSVDASQVDGLVEALWREGIVVVVSAGNDGGRVLRAPADDPTVLTVGAVYSTGSAASAQSVSFSDHGRTEDGVAKPEVTAPGVHLRAPLPTGSVLAGEQTVAGLPAGYGQLSGTSMSAAVASGLVGDLLAARPGLTPAQVKALLVRTATSRLRLVTPAGAVHAQVPTARDAKPSVQLFDLQGWVASFAAPPAPATAVWSSATWSSVPWPAVVWSPATWTHATWSSAAWTGTLFTTATWSDATWSDVTWSESRSPSWEVPPCTI